MQKPVLVFACLIAGCWLTAQTCLILTITPAWGQERKSKPAGKTSKTKKAGNTSALDVKANEIQSGFIKNAEDLANDYYEAGDYDKARILLKSIQALEPEHPNLDQKLKRLDEESLISNEVDLDVNSHDGWEAAGIIVTEGKPIRIKADGSFKLAISGTLGPAGLPLGNPLEFAGDLPVGALIGVVMNSDTTPKDDKEKEKDKKKDRPFFIGEGCDYTPLRTGPLLLRINAPENKNSGKIKVQISGNLKKIKGS
ncbi:MAG: hypothetical protein JWM11_7286 [Planctomycetaceae bacterium]|nr:hypothetical protein [Planctomycetaceae bacterium]